LVERVALLLLVLVTLFLSGTEAWANQSDAPRRGVVFRDVPKKPDVTARYLFYLPGKIVEAGNTRPVSPRFGVYEYEQILGILKNRGFVVISEPRKRDSDVEQYAARVAKQVEGLIKAGVPARHITVAGASQGSWIAMLASTYLKNRDLNFVLIAACSAEDSFLQLVDLHGSVLSIYERSDVAGSCDKFRDDATGLRNYEEMEIRTGFKHGFLYRPLIEWIEPTVAWAKAH
jgi:pimeloyl-ACP methyl ester carboxylesterase